MYSSVHLFSCHFVTFFCLLIIVNTNRGCAVELLLLSRASTSGLVNEAFAWGEGAEMRKILERQARLCFQHNETLRNMLITPSACLVASRTQLSRANGDLAYWLNFDRPQEKITLQTNVRLQECSSTSKPLESSDCTYKKRKHF